MTTTDPRVFSLEEVGERLAGISEKSVTRLINDGLLVRQYVGKKPVVAADELAAYIASLPTEPTRISTRSTR